MLRVIIAYNGIHSLPKFSIQLLDNAHIYKVRTHTTVQTNKNEAFFIFIFKSICACFQA